MLVGAHVCVMITQRMRKRIRRYLIIGPDSLTILTLRLFDRVIFGLYNGGGNL